MPDASAPLVAVIMGSKTDWETMRHADETLTQFGVPHASKVMSAHRTPAFTAEYTAEAEARGIEGIIAAAGRARHLAGLRAAPPRLPAPAGAAGPPAPSRTRSP